MNPDRWRNPEDLPIEATTLLLSAAFDRAALAIETGGNAADYSDVLAALIHGLASRSEGSTGALPIS